MLCPCLRKSRRERRARAEGFILRGSFVSQGTRKESRDRVHHHHGRQFTAAQYKVSNRYFFRRQMLRYALVNTLVSPAKKNDSLQLRVAPRRFLPEQIPRRGHQGNCRLWISSARFRRVADAMPKQRFHRFKQRLRLQHHAFATAEWPVIHGAMTILCKQP